MTWATERQTTEDEDMAYCLLGLFDIFMPLIYGEGKKSAMRRLERELDRVPAAGMVLADDFTSAGESMLTLFLIATTCFTVPFERNSRFTGRESLLADLEARLFKGEQTTKTALVGLGGIGKTQVALELAYRTREKYKNCSVFWLPATDMDSLHQAYRDVAKQLQVAGWDEEKADVKKLVQVHLSQESTRPWLCIFDNADDLSMWIRSPGSEAGPGGLKEYLPQSKQGCVLFTTRDKKVAVKLAGRDVVEVPELDDKGAMHLLQESLVDTSLMDDQRNARAVLQQFTNLPLAIVQGAACINENSMSLADYVSLLDEQEEDVVGLLSEDFEDEHRYPSIKNPVATTWLISFERIRRRDLLAADYLSFMACIDRKDIPQSLLPAGPSRKKELEAIGTLKAYSFIVQRSDTLVYDLHRLVHLVTRSWLRREGALVRWSYTAIARLDEVFPSDEHKNRTLWRTLLPHAGYALRAGKIERDGNGRLSLMWKYAKSMHSDGLYREAEKPFQELFEARKKLKEEGDPDKELLTCMAWLASTYRNQGRWNEAEKLEVQVIETTKRVLGEEHPDMLSSMANLASTYRNQGRWNEAEKLLVQVMETRKRVLGEEHPDTLSSMANLASTYRNQGRWNEAEKLLVQVMETRKRVLGEEHPSTLTSMNNLAFTWKGQGRDPEAVNLMSKCVQARKRILGASHPHTLSSLEVLAGWRLKSMAIRETLSSPD
jgi:tetratricopeptide (TPR) repeat protein